MDTHPLLKDLNTQMRCGIFSNAGGDILIVHDQEINNELDYVEYDLSDDSFHLIFTDGRMQSLGIEFDPRMKSNLQQGKEVTLSHLKDKQIIASRKTAFIVRNF